MVNVFVDAELLVVAGTGVEPSLVPDVASLDDLVEAGHRVAVIGTADRAASDVVARLDAVPLPESGPGWYLTVDPSMCVEARRRGLRPLLVGPSDGAVVGTGHPFDEEARDLHDAMLRILAADAMEPQSDRRSETAGHGIGRDPKRSCNVGDVPDEAAEVPPTRR